MKTIFITILMVSLTSQAAVHRFEFKTLKKPITVTASTKEQAFKIAASECFSKLTGGKYPGEEKGLDIIDICANPKM